MLSSLTSVNVAQYLPTTLLLAGAALLTFLFLFNLKGRLSRRPRHQSAANLIEQVRHDHGIKVHDHPKAERHLDTRPAKAVVAHDEMTRRMAAQIENKTLALETVIRQADERIRLLQRALDQAPGASISPAKACDLNADAPEIMEPLPESEILTKPLPATTNGTAKVAKATAEAPTAPPLTPPLEPPLIQTRAIDPLSQNVYELSDRGRSSIEIAQHLDEQVGKVELILALRDI